MNNVPNPNYAFVDSQNLNLGVRSQGWAIDYKKLRLYLKNKYNVSRAYLFIGKTDDNQDLYDTLTDAGYTIVFKPTVSYLENGKETMKGNVDAELVLYAAGKVFNDYDKAVIVSGDGDFYCLAEYLVEHDKLLHIVVPNRRYSKLLSEYTPYIVRLDLLRKSLQYGRSLKSGTNSGGSKTKGKKETGSARLSRTVAEEPVIIQE